MNSKVLNPQQIPHVNNTLLLVCVMNTLLPSASRRSEPTLQLVSFYGRNQFWRQKTPLSDTIINLEKINYSTECNHYTYCGNIAKFS